MPFTFAHPAAAVPLATVMGRWGSLSALAIGSMMPDIPFFLGIDLRRHETHGVDTLLTWSLPVGLVLYALFHALLRQALTDLAPAAVQARLPRGAFTMQGWRGALAVAVSLVVGAATHLLWDGFTHPGTPIVASIPVLQINLGKVDGYNLYVFKFLQHASSVTGLALLAAWSWTWYVRTPPVAAAAPAMTAATRSCICALLVTLPLAAGAWSATQSPWPTLRLPHFIFTALPTFFWLLSGYALAWRLVRARA